MASLEAGKRLADRYVLLERLGDGGHAEVWAAQDETAGARLALKFLHLRSCSADEALLVLRHEAEMARRLDHPGVLWVEAPQRDGAMVFLPIELAAGGDASRLRGAPWWQVLPVLLQVARVLEHAHSRGVVHRDIKPGNVLFDGFGNVRVTDFGTAARTGCTDAMAAGSPFSASPQQLLGEAATTADDVYGLGALAYELLTRYPPYYPDFNAQRVQHESPARPVPVQPAPDALVDFIVSMLARDAQARPDLQQVMQVFEDLLSAATSAAVQGAALVTESAAPVAPVAARRRYVATTGWLVAAAVLAVIAMLLLPHRAATPGLPLAAPTTPAKAVTAETAVASVADAIVSDAGAPAPATATAATEPSTETSLPQALQAGETALSAGQPAVAQAAFLRAQTIDAGNQDAQRGLTRAAALEKLLTTFAAATRTEARGDLAAAQAQYRDVLQQRADFQPAQAALARVLARQRANEFETLLTTGAEALGQGQLPAAESAYTRAAALNPGDPRAVDGQARVAEIRTSQRNAQDLATGVALEREERWDEAVAHYQAVLARDAKLFFAQDGQARATRRVQLDRELQDYLDRPQRLSAAAVRIAAERALARSDATTPHTPRLGRQVMQLKSLLAALATQVRVAITSDNSTEVSMTQLGRLGVFHLREVELPPGRYTVIGRRDGFRDVRLELDITSGQQATALAVQCTERI
ncbi:MAG: protein kinase [Steroidobacteraceae bacterium]